MKSLSLSWESVSIIIAGFSAILAAMFFVFPEYALEVAGISPTDIFFVRLAAVLGVLLNGFACRAGCLGALHDHSVLHAGLAKIISPLLMIVYLIVGYFPPVILAVAIPDIVCGLILLFAWSRGNARF